MEGPEQAKPIIDIEEDDGKSKVWYKQTAPRKDPKKNINIKKKKAEVLQYE